MILKLRSLLLTSTHLNTDWVSLVPGDEVASGMYATGHFLITAFDATGRVWISNHHPACLGEGMETQAEKLEAFLLDRIGLPAADGALTCESPRGELDRIVGEFYDREF